MDRIDSKFNLKGADSETITVTVNGNSNVPGVQCALGTQIVPGTFKLSKTSPVVFLDINIDFNQAVGDKFDITVTGSAANGFTSNTAVVRSGAFRAVKYRFETA